MVDFFGSGALPTIEHAAYLEPLDELPGSVLRHPTDERHHGGQFACHFCGVGTSARIPLNTRNLPSSSEPLGGVFYLDAEGPPQVYPALLHGGYLQLMTPQALVATGAEIEGELELDDVRQRLSARAFDLLLEPDGQILSQRFMLHPAYLEARTQAPSQLQPTPGCAKLNWALGERSSRYPLHLRPSVLDITGRRVPLFYEEALERFAHLVLEHRPPRARTLLYASGQLDYFAVFAMQEVFRLLGVRNMTSNCEHGYLAGGIYKSFVAGQPGPFMTIAQALNQPRGLYLLNGWNGALTHPPVFQGLLQQPHLDAWLVDVMHTETAQQLSAQIGPERVLLIRSGGDSHLALGIAHELLSHYPGALEQRFLTHFAEAESFERFAALARSDNFRPQAVAERIAPEFAYRERILNGIRQIAQQLANPESVPVHIPSMGLSQTGGIVPHCLWANLLAMLGKFGLTPEGLLAGGVLQLPVQANDETHLQGLSPQHFMGRLPVDAEGAAEAALRMDLPPDAYDKVLQVTPRSALDFSEPDSRRELYLFFGGQFATSMMNQPRWLRKLRDQQTQFIVVDPTPDEFALKYAALILPTPPHVATTKLFQNGEWRLSLSLPRRKAPSQTRSDTSLIYDLMATIGEMLKTSPSLWLQHPDLAQRIQAGYLEQRFGAGLRRDDGEVNRPQLWERIQRYYAGGNGRALYCQPLHADGRQVSWDELMNQGSLIYGGVGTTRQVLDYSQPERLPFSDLRDQPVRYRFFVPSETDLALPRGVILSTGRSTLSEETDRTNLSEPYPLFVSHMLAERYNLSAGDRVWVTNRETRAAMVATVQPTSRLKGETLYLSLDPNGESLRPERHPHLLTSHRLRCPYTGQTGHKLTRVELQRVEDHLRR
ncbi:MAG: hypothetical protein ACO1RX_00870 [Candidatus Sericytochromatia bacterium]